MITRNPVIITWTDTAVTWGSQAAFPGQAAAGASPTSVIALASANDPELSDYDALYETTSRPCDWLWGPGTPDEALDWLHRNSQPGDQAETIDRLFLLRYHDGLLWLPQKPATVAAVTGAATEGTWYLLRADSPFPAFNHQRWILSGYANPEPGPRHDPGGACKACPTETIGSGTLTRMLARAAELGADVVPRTAPDTRVTMARMPRYNRIQSGSWDIPPEI